jgi:hypothetical protein
VPLIARVIGVEPADHHGPRAHGGRVIGHAEMQRLQPAAELRDGFHIGHAERGFDQRLKPDAGG